MVKQRKAAGVFYYVFIFLAFVVFLNVFDWVFKQVLKLGVWDYPAAVIAAIIVLVASEKKLEQLYESFTFSKKN